MLESAWVADENGIMVFEPSTSLPSFETIQQILSYSSEDDEYVKVSTEDVNENYESSLSSGSLPRHKRQLSFQAKSEPLEDTAVACFTPSDTVSIGSGHHLNLSPSDTSPSSTTSYQDVSIFDQLRTIAASPAGHVSSTNSRRSTLLSFTSDSIAHSDSESSPCPTRGNQNTPYATSTRRQFFKKRKIGKQHNSKFKRPSWIQTLRSGKKNLSTARETKTENALSLEYLENLKAKRHGWTVNDRITLLSLRRWYILKNSEFKDIFNSLTGLKMPHRTLATQFAGGSTPFNEVRRPFYSVPFDDPENVYKNIRGHIESRAAELGIKLRQREEPETHKYEEDGLREIGWTSSSIESLLRVQPQLRLSSAQDHGVSKSLGGYAIADGAFDDDCKFVNVEVSTTPASSTDSQYSIGSSATSYHLAFRVWDANSRTVFKEAYGFVADLFAHRISPVPAPLARNDSMFDVLANAHLSFKGNTSSFVSVASSLLQALNYASSMDNPRVALIDLHHPDLNHPDKKFAAREIIEDLQSKGEMWWTRYKAAAEHIIWGDLCNSAILHIFHLSELEDLITESANVSALMNLDIFDGSTRTRTIARTLQRKGIALNATTAQAMGRVARVFGLGSRGITKAHISDFITYLTDGWAIRADPRHDIHAMAGFASRFAIALGSHNPPLHLQDIIAAFMDGFERGTQNLAYFSRRRRTI